VHILVINAGSSSIKYSHFDKTLKTILVAGEIQQIGEALAKHSYTIIDANGINQDKVITLRVDDHGHGFALMTEVLQQPGVKQKTTDLMCIGHRVVHGGERFREPVLINKEVLDQIRLLSLLAPLHNPINLLGIELAQQQYPGIPQVAVFDTAFHQTLPAHAFHYALPHKLYSVNHIRRYGFHGIAHHYLAMQTAQWLDKDLDSLNLITLHLGNGASICAIKQGCSIDTSMGMTPLEGLVMGTRSGDLDPSIPLYLAQQEPLSNVENILNQESGLKGLCGENDMRIIHQLADDGDKQAQLALEIYCYRIKKYIGAYYAALGHVDAIVFSGGIGEHDARIRKQSCTDLAALGIVIDPIKNQQAVSGQVAIHDSHYPITILVIAADEDRMIAMQSYACITHKQTQP
jgi:acetate kinase